MELNNFPNKCHNHFHVSLFCRSSVREPAATLWSSFEQHDEYLIKPKLNERTEEKSEQLWSRPPQQQLSTRTCFFRGSSADATPQQLLFCPVPPPSPESPPTTLRFPRLSCIFHVCYITPCNTSKQSIDISVRLHPDDSVSSLNEQKRTLT